MVEANQKISSIVFDSKKLEIVAFLFDKRDEAHSISDIESSVDVSRPVISKLVNDLAGFGLLEKEKKGNMHLITVQEESPYFQPFQRILELDSQPLKNAAEEVAEKIIEEDENVKSVYLFGSVARGTPNINSDIDILIVHTGNPDRNSIEPVINKASKQRRISLSPTWYEEEELKKDYKSGIAFAERLENESQLLAGEDIWKKEKT